MDYTPNSRRLSEISHLFLSDVRKKQTGGETRPHRSPPGNAAGQPTGQFKGDVSVDLTPEEFAQVMRPAAADAPVFKAVRAVVAHHLGEAMQERVVDLAMTLGRGNPVGVIYADDANVRVCRVDATIDGASEEAAGEAFDAQRLREVFVELDQDVCQWLLVLPDARSTETKTLLNRVAHWTLLTGTDHDGVVAAYRTLKGLCGENRPSVSVSVFGATDAADLAKTCQKLSGVCEQFLKINLAVGPAVPASPDAVESCLMEAAANESGDTHWPVLNALVEGAAAVEELPPAVVIVSPTPVAAPVAIASFSRTPMTTADAVPVMRMTPPAAAVIEADDAQSVIDLPDADASPAGILRAVVRGGSEWVESPVKAPGLPDAVVAVSRDRRLTLLAVASAGLADLRSIATAFRWMTENRALIAMAVPQLAVDAFAEPRLHLLVDHADSAADALQPLLAAGSVSVAAYRKLRWAGRMGLLLEAA